MVQMLPDVVYIYMVIVIVDLLGYADFMAFKDSSPRGFQALWPLFLQGLSRVRLKPLKPVRHWGHWDGLRCSPIINCLWIRRDFR